MALHMLLIVLGVALAMLQYSHSWHVGSIRVKTVKFMVSTNVHCFCCVVLMLSSALGVAHVALRACDVHCYVHLRSSVSWR